MNRNETLIAILKDQVVPALGCTEPGAVAYAVARAKELLGTKVDSMVVYVDKNVLKNGLGVGIPGTPERGIVFACALALEIGKSEYKLEVLKDVTPEAIDAARAVAASGCIDLRLKEDAPGLYISVDAKGQGGESRVVIEGAHTNITYEAVNGKVVKEGSAPVNCDDAETSTTGIKFEIKKYSIDDMIAFANEVPSEDIAFMQDGIDMNMKIATDAIDRGLSICNTLLKKDSSLEGKAKAYTAGGSENRMAGSPLPVMSSAGSGNHGMTAIVPINIIGQGKGIDNDKIRRAVALSHLVTNYIKVYLGPLSPVCGCGVAAGMGAAAGLTYMQGGTNAQVKAAINNMSAGITGMLCDGAKMGCSLKVACAAAAAIDASELALNHVEIPSDNGILSSKAELTMQNIATVSVKGMDNTDNVILQLMLNRT
ncbi:serine dehydratase subunit alpha family protein [Fournierella massiliensis]|nr:L-serine ammonia-lyase, iron-sulfur-dependent, subunit alpha [Fournierella massiliensis]MCF2557787.1 serine dehydratase subunit alpha family protein [Fournierella massiliensis]